MPNSNAAHYRLPLVPNLFSNGIEMKAPTTANALIKIGNIFYIAGNICPTIYPEYAITTPIPIICWETDKWNAAKSANLFVFSYFGLRFNVLFYFWVFYFVYLFCYDNKF